MLAIEGLVRIRAVKEKALSEVGISWSRSRSRVEAKNEWVKEVWKWQVLVVFVLALSGLELCVLEDPKSSLLGTFWLYKDKLYFQEGKPIQVEHASEREWVEESLGEPRPNLHIPQRADSYAELVVAALNAAVEQVWGEYQ